MNYVRRLLWQAAAHEITMLYRKLKCSSDLDCAHVRKNKTGDTPHPVDPPTPKLTQYSVVTICEHQD